MNKLLVSVTLASSLAFLGGCSPSVTAETFYGDWALVSATDSTGSFDTTITDVIVTIGEKNIGGRVCNNFGGEFTGPASDLTVGPLAATEMYCSEPAGIMDLETRFLADLGVVTSGSIVDGDLVLTGNGVTLEFDAVG